MRSRETILESADSTQYPNRLHDPMALNNEVNRQVGVLRETFPTIRGLSTAQTTDLLLEVGEHTKHAAVVCARLNRQIHSTPQPTPKIAAPKTETLTPQRNYIEKWITARTQKQATSN